jgi:trigger factor
MLKAVEDISMTKKRLKIEIPAEVIEGEIRSSLEKLKTNTMIPGFRPGKAPLSIIEKRFGKRVEGEVLDKLIPRVYVEALSEAALTPLTNPVVEEALDFKRNEPVSMTFTVEVMPKIETLKYELLKVKDIPVTVNDSDVEDVLRKLMEERATYEPSEGPVEMDDLIVFDYSVTGEDVEQKDQVFKVGGGSFPDDFSKRLLGKRRGEECTIETEFPEDHNVQRFAGKHLAFQVTLKDIKKKRLHESNEELAKDMGFESPEALKGHIKEETTRAKQTEVKKIQKAEIVRQLVESHEFDPPESLIEQELNLLVTNAMIQSGTEQDDMSAENIEVLKNEMRSRAVWNVKVSLLIDAIGQKENVKVTDDEVKNTINSISQTLSTTPENVKKLYISRDGSLDGLKHTIYQDKVLALILTKAVFEKGE